MGCGICHEILHDAVSAQPCLHSFCGGCYSEWKKNNETCPQCRKIVHSVAENHTINNLVSAYLKMNPEKRRNAADLALLDAWNKITDDGGMSPSGLADWQTGWQAGWQAGRQDGWQAGRQDGWLAGRLAGWQAGRQESLLAGWLADGLVGWLAGWPAGWPAGGPAGWMAGGLAGWLAGRLLFHQP